MPIANLVTFTVILSQILFTTTTASVIKKALSTPEEECHPKPSVSSQVYILGYGSLLNTASKNKTYPNTGINIPVNVTGFTRNWNCEGTPVGHSTTFLGVDKGNDTTSFNGVVFRLPRPESIFDFDRREVYYCRKLVPRGDIRFLIDKSFNATVEQDWPDEGAEFWTYIVRPEFVAWPSERFPIVQSYVDVFLGGCIEMETTYNLTWYRDACITATQGWEYPWVNDRVLPRRPFVNTPNAYQIDKLIQSHFPNHFDQASVEKGIVYNYPGKSGSVSLVVGKYFSMPVLLMIWMFVGML